MARSYSLEGTGIDRAQVRQIAVVAACDERSVISEILAQLGKREPARGMVADRIRIALRSAKFPALVALQVAAKKKVLRPVQNGTDRREDR